jgi:hypothetical protein
MKFNKWTLGLAAVGAVSLASAARAEEKANVVQTALSATTLSGYVDTSVEWNPGTGNAHVPNYAFNTPGKADGFNLDVIKVSLEHPLDESEWAAGYKVDLIYGPDANFFGTSPIGGIAATDFAIKQAYVTVRTPIGNGIDWKLGVFDSIIGYESFDAVNNPNFTRSYGYTVEPTTHTGLLGTYKVSDAISVTAGIANTTGPIIGGETINPAGIGGAPQVVIGRSNPPKAESYKTYTGAVALTAPQDWGFLAGSSAYVGVINGWNGGAAIAGVQDNFYAGVTLNTPVTGLKVGTSYDYVGTQANTYVNAFGGTAVTKKTWADDVAMYASYQATEKLSVHARGEYLWQDDGANGGAQPVAGPAQIFALTGTIQYDLWKNVLSRLEVRWDHQAGTAYGFSGSDKSYGGTLGSLGGINAGIPSTVGTQGAPGLKNSWLVAANLIYKF